MQNYQHIVIAVDIAPSATAVLDRAKMLAQQHGAKITLMHVIEPIISAPGQELFPSVPVELEQVQKEHAEQFLSEISKKQGFESAEKIVSIGSIKQEIFRVCEELKCDLIVMGTHGRHGIGLLFGSTASAVLHGTKCDVLAVRIQD